MPAGTLSPENPWDDSEPGRSGPDPPQMAWDRAIWAASCRIARSSCAKVLLQVGLSSGCWQPVASVQLFTLALTAMDTQSHPQAGHASARHKASRHNVTASNGSAVSSRCWRPHVCPQEALQLRTTAAVPSTAGQAAKQSCGGRLSQLCMLACIAPLSTIYLAALGRHWPAICCAPRGNHAAAPASYSSAFSLCCAASASAIYTSSWAASGCNVYSPDWGFGTVTPLSARCCVR